MSSPDRLAFIRQKATQRKIKWSLHALGKLGTEPFTTEDVESALQRAVIVEHYEHAHRFLPDCLVLVFVSPALPIHCVIGINELHDYILVVTVYRPDEKEWQNDWRTRK